MERGLTRTRAVGGGEGARRPAKAAGTGRLPHELEVHQVELEAQKEELQRIRRELQESRDRFSELYDYAPIGYLTLDREGRITQVNLAAAELLRQPRDTLVGLELSSVVEATEADRLWIQRHAALVTRSKQSCDVHLRGPNGSVAQVRLDMAPDRDLRSGRVNLVLVDVTDLRETQDELRKSDARFSEIAQYIQDVFYVRELDGRISYVSPGFGRIWDRPPDWLEGREDGWLETIDPEDRARVSAAWERLRRGAPVDEAYRVLRPDGAVRWVQSRGFAVLTARGHVQRTVGVVRDITNERALEHNLRQAQKIEALGTLAGGLTHNLRNVLQAIMASIGFAQMGGAQTPPIARALDRAVGATNKGVALIEQLMTFARKQEGEMKLRAVRLDEQVREAAGLIKVLVGTQIALDVRTEAPEGVVLVDPVQLEQVLLNLAGNARDAMPDGGTLLIETREVVLDEEAAKVHGLAPAPHLLISVQDSGAGMDEATKAHVFEPFFTTKEVGKGTGLGLSTAFALVRHFGGRIEVESQPGVGTTFSIWLPAVP